MTKLKRVVTFGVAITTMSGSLFADESLGNPRQNTFKVWAAAGVYYAISTSATSSDGIKKITDNTKEGKAASTIKVFPLFDLRYTFAESKTQVYFGIPLEGSNLSVSLGVVQPTNGLGIVSTSVAQSIGKNVWGNPYEENVERSSTNVNYLTAAIKIKKLANTGLSISYSNTTVDVKNDEIGDIDSDLKRDGSINSLGATFIIGLDQTSIIVPGIDYTKGDFNGDSNSYTKTGVKLSYLKFSREYLFSFGTSASTSSYDKTHPIYDKTRNDIKLGCYAMLRFLQLFNEKSLHANVIMGSRVEDSNINFFDKKSVFAMATIGYSF